MGHGTLQPEGIYIKKIYRSLQDGRILTFPEMLLSDLRDLLTVRQFAAASLTWVDNSPDEITALTAEMLDILDGTGPRTPQGAHGVITRIAASCPRRSLRRKTSSTWRR